MFNIIQGYVLNVFTCPAIMHRDIIANHGFESASFLSNPWFNDATFACLHCKYA